MNGSNNQDVSCAVNGYEFWWTASSRPAYKNLVLVIALQLENNVIWMKIIRGHIPGQQCIVVVFLHK